MSLKLIEIGSCKIYCTLGTKITPSNLGKWVFRNSTKCLPWFWSTWSGGDSRGSTGRDRVCKGRWVANRRKCSRCSTWIVNLVLVMSLEVSHILCRYWVSWWLAQFGLQVNTIGPDKIQRSHGLITVIAPFFSSALANFVLILDVPGTKFQPQEVKNETTNTPKIGPCQERCVLSLIKCRTSIHCKTPPRPRIHYWVPYLAAVYFLHLGWVSPTQLPSSMYIVCTSRKMYE